MGFKQDVIQEVMCRVMELEEPNQCDGLEGEFDKYELPFMEEAFKMLLELKHAGMCEPRLL